MPNLTLLGWMFLAWSLVTLSLALLLIYQNVIGLKEDDQLFLDAAESRFAEEQHQVLAKLARIRRFAKGLGYVSGGIMVAMFGLAVYLVRS